MDKLINCVQNAFDALTKEKLGNIFLTLQKCMKSTMMASEDNKYKIEHMNKEKHRCEGRLPVSILCHQSGIETAELSLNM